MANLRYRYLTVQEWRAHAPEFEPGDIVQAPSVSNDGPSVLEQIRARTDRSIASAMHWVPIEHGLLFIARTWSRVRDHVLIPPESTEIYQNISVAAIRPGVVEQLLGTAPVVFEVELDSVPMAWLGSGSTLAVLTDGRLPVVFPGDVYICHPDDPEHAPEWRVVWVRDAPSFRFPGSLNAPHEAFLACSLAIGACRENPVMRHVFDLCRRMISAARPSLFAVARLWVGPSGQVFAVDALDAEHWKIGVDILESNNRPDITVSLSEHRPDELAVINVFDAIPTGENAIELQYRDLYPWERDQIAGYGF